MLYPTLCMREILVDKRLDADSTHLRNYLVKQRKARQSHGRSDLGTLQVARRTLLYYIILIRMGIAERHSVCNRGRDVLERT